MVRPRLAGSDAAAAIMANTRVQRILFLLPLLATIYTGISAFFLARGAPITYGMIVLSELLLLGGGVMLLFSTGLRREDWPPIALMYIFVIVAIVTSMITGRLMLEVLRSALIIGIFSMLGERTSLRTLDRLFLALAIIVLAVLVLEIASLTTYVSLFQPQAFFEATRGLKASEYNETGLFNTAASFSGRFSFGVFDIPRTSSIFMEQISNSNFACILVIFLSARWSNLPLATRVICVVTTVLVLITTNARFASLLVLAMCFGHFIFPLLGRRLLPLFSLGLALGAFAIILKYPNAIEDDLPGRLAHVGRQFAAADVSFYLGGDAIDAIAERDSGYTYIIGSSTIFGAIALWFYVALYPRANDVMSRRVIWGLAAYFLGQLLVSSTSLLSIKTAALLWFLAGCVRAQPPVAVPLRRPPGLAPASA